MPSGWDVYYVVFLSAVLALVIPAALGLVSKLVAPSRTQKNRSQSEEKVQEDSIGRRFNTRFFLSANVALPLVTLALVLIPCVGTIKTGSPGGGTVMGLISILSIALFSALGLLYSSHKGDLNWSRYFRAPTDEKGEREQ